MPYARPTACQRCGSPIAGIPARIEVTRVCPVDPQIRRWLTCASCATAIANYLTLGSAPMEAERAKRRGFLVRSIIATLQKGPQPWARIFEFVAASGYGDQELRQAAEVVPVIKTFEGDREIWDMERYG